MFLVLKWMGDALTLCDSEAYAALAVKWFCTLVAKVMERDVKIIVRVVRTEIILRTLEFVVFFI